MFLPFGRHLKYLVGIRPAGLALLHTQTNSKELLTDFQSGAGLSSASNIALTLPTRLRAGGNGVRPGLHGQGQKNLAAVPKTCP